MAYRDFNFHHLEDFNELPLTSEYFMGCSLLASEGESRNLGLYKFAKIVGWPEKIMFLSNIGDWTPLLGMQSVAG